jgi:hypothetical protein
VLGLPKGAVKCVIVGVVDSVDAPSGDYDHTVGTGLVETRP